MNPPPADAFNVGIVYVKQTELNAIYAMLDEVFPGVPRAPGDPNEYTLGRIGEHNVVIVGPPRGEQGAVVMTRIVTTLRLTFKNITVGLLVGIGGGIPHLPAGDVRLGDVVVGAPDESGVPAVVQWDLGKRTSHGFENIGTLGKPPSGLCQIVSKVNAEHWYPRKGEKSFDQHLARFSDIEYQKPSSSDRLFKATYDHEPDSICAEHEVQHEVSRNPRVPDRIRIHTSTILSGNSVMKDARERDRLSRRHHDALCIEMEAAGVMDVFPCLVVRGICDYADSHKNNDWQNYAAATAAAYAREILLKLSKEAPRTSEIMESVKAPGVGVDTDRQHDHFNHITNNNGLQQGYNYAHQTFSFSNTIGR